MEPKNICTNTFQWKDEDELGDTITVSGTNDDTITLSSSSFSFDANTVIGGGFTYPTTISATGGPFTLSSGTNASPWFRNSGSAKIQLDGEGADIEVNGESLMTMLHRIEERLNILTPNDKLEVEWEELRALGNKYRELEQHIKDKQATWDRLKAMPPPAID